MGLRFDEQIVVSTNMFAFGHIDPRIDGGRYSPRVPILTPGTIVHHTFDIAIWVRTGLNTDYVCDGCVLADNRLGFRLAFQHAVNNSLVVGLSANYRCSENRSWPEDGAVTRAEVCTKDLGLSTYEGHAIYDGPNLLERVHFAGFYGRDKTPSSYAFMNMQANMKSTAQIIRKVTFDPDVPLSAKVDLYGSHLCSLFSSQIMDEDGSVTGIPNSFLVPEIMTTSETPDFPNFLPGFFKYFRYQWDKQFNLAPAGVAPCTKLGTAKTWSCTDRMGLLKFINQYSDRQIVYVNYTRSDGYKMSDPGYGVGTSISVRLNNPIYYGVESSLPSPWMIVRLMEVLVGDYVIWRADGITNKYQFITRMLSGDWIRLNPLTAAQGKTFDDLVQSPVTAVFVDLSIGSAWVKLVAVNNPAIAGHFGTYRAKFKYNAVAEVKYEPTEQVQSWAL
jgi:hypothetical protein